MKTYEIEGTTFLVDTDSLILREKNNLDNIIRQEVMMDHATHYEFFFRNTNDTIVEVKMPQFVHLDPEGMRSRYTFPTNTPLPLRDKDFKCQETLLQHRLGGKLPVVDIHGWRYIVDASRNELWRETKSPQRPTNFEELPKTEYGYRISLDGKTGAIVFDEEIMPPHRLVVVEIPDLEVVDPVGMAQALGLPQTFFVDTFPVRTDLRARLILAPPKNTLRRIKLQLQPITTKMSAKRRK